MSTKKYIECGKIINTHGSHGGVKLESWCNTPEDLASLKNIYICKNGEYNKIRVLKSAIFKQFVLFDLAGVSDMDEAMSMKGQVVFADRADFELEDGEYFIADVIGIDVIDAHTNVIYGKVKDVINRGASDIYVVQTENGERMIPVVDEFIVNVDISKGVFVNVIPGLLD